MRRTPEATDASERIKEAQLRRVVHMGTAAQLGRKVPGFYHPDHVAILFAEQSHSSHGLCFGNGHFPGLYRHGGQNDVIDHLLHVLEFLRRQAGEMRKVEPDGLLGYHLARLLHVVAQNLAQRCLQKVGAGVVSHDGKPPLLVHRRSHRVSHAQNTAFDSAPMDEYAGHGFHAVEHTEGHAV